MNGALRSLFIAKLYRERVDQLLFLCTKKIAARGPSYLYRCIGRAGGQMRSVAASEGRHPSALPFTKWMQLTCPPRSISPANKTMGFDQTTYSQWRKPRARSKDRVWGATSRSLMAWTSAHTTNPNYCPISVVPRRPGMERRCQWRTIGQQYSLLKMRLAGKFTAPSRPLIGRN